KQAIDSIMNFVRQFGDPLIQSEYSRIAADYFKVDERLLRLTNEKGKNARQGDAPQVERLHITPAERIFLRAILAMPSLIEGLEGVFSDKLLSVLATKNIIPLIIQNYNKETGEIDFRKITPQLSAAEQAEFRSVFESTADADNEPSVLAQQMEASVMEFIEILNRYQFKQLGQRIKIAERENNITEVLRLMNEKSKYKKSKYTSNAGGTVENHE
ncbi:MAG: hypothetical protein GY765_36450, partial [bacterium]|nr:hypothetical protein [bacterium]